MNFESFLIDNGWKAYSVNPKTRQYEEPKPLSTMGRICTHYIHKRESDTILCIEKGINIDDVDFVKAKNEIFYGLSEKGSPPTLIYPRPRIKPISIRGNCWESNVTDARMERIFKAVPYGIVLESLFDKSIVFDMELIDSKFKDSKSL